MPNEYEIEIVDFNAIEGGIEVFARAWKNGVQLGFGKDGTIDIERFRIFNPPVLVDDPLGDIVITSTNELTGEVSVRTLREDPLLAIQESLTQIIERVGKTGTNIVVGSRGNTTSTFYSGAGDGYVRNNNANFATCRAATSGTSATYTNVNDPVQTVLYAGTYYIDRGFVPIDTSALPDSDTISSATLDITPQSVVGLGHSLNVYGASQASDTTLAVGDFDEVGSTEFATNISVTTTAVKTFTLNASGIAAISMTGYTKFSLRDYVYDAGNTAPPGNNGASYYFSEQTGTTSDPKLVVVHSAGASFTPTPMNTLSLMGVG